MLNAESQKIDSLVLEAKNAQEALEEKEKKLEADRSLIEMEKSELEAMREKAYKNIDRIRMQNRQICQDLEADIKVKNEINGKMKNEDLKMT